MNQRQPTRTTIADIARASGVSPATVSRVLNGNPAVAPELVRRVEAAVAHANYRPSAAGRAQRRQRSDLWAAIIPDVRNPFFHRLVEAFEKVAHANGYSVVLCNTHEDLQLERSAIESVVGHQVSGALIAAVSASKSRVAPFERAGIPVLTVDRRVAGFTGDSINVDNQMIGRLAADHLVQQGCTQPLIVTHAGDLTPLREREKGFVARMRELGHPMGEQQVARIAFQADDKRGEVRSALDAMADVDAVFATTNTLTSHVYVVLRSAGASIGPDVALIGVDDDQWNVMVEPPVTVVEQPAEQLGEWAGQLLVARAAGRDMKHARILLDPVVRERASSLRHQLTAVPTSLD